MKRKLLTGSKGKGFFCFVIIIGIFLLVNYLFGVPYAYSSWELYVELAIVGTAIYLINIKNIVRYVGILTIAVTIICAVAQIIVVEYGGETVLKVQEVPAELTRNFECPPPLEEIIRVTRDDAKKLATEIISQKLTAKLPLRSINIQFLSCNFVQGKENVKFNEPTWVCEFRKGTESSGYVIISAENPNKKFFVSKLMKYCPTKESINKQLIGKSIDEIKLNISPEGEPYYMVTLMGQKSFLSQKDINEVMIINPVNGNGQKKNLPDNPEWMSGIQNKDFFNRNVELWLKKSDLVQKKLYETFWDNFHVFIAQLEHKVPLDDESENIFLLIDARTKDARFLVQNSVRKKVVKTNSAARATTTTRKKVVESTESVRHRCVILTNQNVGSKWFVTVEGLPGVEFFADNAEFSHLKYSYGEQTVELSYEGNLEDYTPGPDGVIQVPITYFVNPQVKKEIGVFAK